MTGRGAIEHTLEMYLSKFIRTVIACAIVGTSIEVSAASVPVYPTKTVRMVVNAAPGGANDVLGRMVARSMSEAFGQTVVVDNRGGAGGNVGAEIVAHAPADGYTLLYCTSSVVVAPALYTKLNYELRDLAPITQAGRFPLVVAVHPSLPVKNISEMIALAKKRGGLNYGSTGPGSMNHLTGVLLNNVAGIENVHVGYKGAGPMMIALLTNEVGLGIATVFSAAPHIKAGRLRALAVSSLKSIPALPGVPPLASQFPGFETSQWHGYFTTAGTPAPIIAVLNGEIVKALRSAAVREALENGGGEPVGNTPQQFAAAIGQDAPKYAKLVKISGAKAD
jgi:tripartite-type tricarboxylate transporter receptor subunit TctC